MKHRMKTFVILAASLLLFAAPQTSTAAWMDGTFTETQTINCVSQIQGSPYMEVLTTEYMGYGPTVPPKVGDIYYGRIVVGTTGNPCAGPYVHIEVALPKYTEFAIDATHQIECWTQQISNAGTYQQITDGSCPTQPSMGIYGTGFYSLDSNPAPNWAGGPWPLALGRMIYIYFPIRSSTPLAGMAGTYTLLTGAIQAIDGYNTWDGPQAGWNGSNAPSSGPYQWVTVSDYTPVISYQTTTILTNTSAHVSGTLNHNGAKGSIYIDIGTTTSYGYSLGPTAAPGTATTPITADWTGLTSGTLYHWRIRYVRADGVATNGADQTFTTSGSAGVPPTAYGLIVSGNSLWHLGYTSSDMGAHYTLTAFIDTPGYYFKSWNIDSGAITSTANPYVLTMGNSNHSVAVVLGYYDADLSITNNASPASIASTGQVTYTLTATNHGNIDPTGTPTAPNVIVTDTLPLGMAYVSSSASCAESSGVVTCNLGTIANGASASATVVAKPSVGLVSKTVINKATVSSDASDLLLSNNTATVSTIISSYGVGAGAHTPAASSSAVKGATNVPMVQLFTMATGTENMKIQKITVQAGGTGNDASDITAVKLYLDVNGNGVVDGGDTVLASGTFAADNGSLDLTLSTALTVTAGTPLNLLVTYDFNTTLASALPFTLFSLVFVGMLAEKHTRKWMLLVALGVAVLWFNACGGGGGGGGSSSTATLASISVTPASPATGIGSSQQFTATGMYSDSTAQNITSSVTWVSSNQTVASISASGLASVVSGGTTTITAASGSISGSTLMTGTTNSISPTSSTYQLTVTGITAKGAASGQTITLTGLPVVGTTVTVNK